MKFLSILALTAAAALAQGHITPQPGDYRDSLLPDPVLTPGVANPDVTQANIHETICIKNWTSTIRPPASFTNKLKAQQMKDLALPGELKDYEEDHYRPLEIGGAPRDPHNLYPEIWPLAHQKDLIENWLHKQVCADKMTLDEAWKEMQQWPAVYEKLKGHPVQLPSGK